VINMCCFNKINSSMIVDALKQLPTEETVKYFLRMSRNPTHWNKMCFSERGSLQHSQVGGSLPHTRSELTPWLSPWAQVRWIEFRVDEIRVSSELKTEASNIRTSFNILPIVQTTIGRYQRTNRPILIIGKTADNRPIPIIGRLSVHL